MDKPTVVIGASPDPEKYSYKAVLSLQKKRMTAYAAGIHAGTINGTVIELNKPHFENVHTVTLYVSPKNLESWKTYILSLNPKRIIFNPGTESQAFYNEASAKGIECLEACTLVMLGMGAY